MGGTENNGNNGFKMKVSEFRGYVTRALGEFEGAFTLAREERTKLNNKIDDNLETLEHKIEGSFSTVYTKIDKIDVRVTKLYLKVGTIGGVAALLTSVMFWLFRNQVFGGPKWMDNYH